MVSGLEITNKTRHPQHTRQKNTPHAREPMAPLRFFQCTMHNRGLEGLTVAMFANINANIGSLCTKNRHKSYQFVIL